VAHRPAASPQRSARSSAAATATAPSEPLTRTDWQTTKDDIVITVRASTNRTPTATLVQFHVTVASEDYFIRELGFNPSADLNESYGENQEVSNCFVGQPPVHRTERTFERAYRAIGRKTFKATAVLLRNGTCDAESTSITVEGQIDVTEGARPSNGPVRVTVRYANQVGTSQERGVVKFQGGGGDPDGYVHRMVLDWGDGTPPEEIKTQGLEFCEESPRRWPYGPNSFMDIVEHRYPEYSTRYIARFTIFSVGCDGRNLDSAALDAEMLSPRPPR